MARQSFTTKIKTHLHSIHVRESEKMICKRPEFCNLAGITNANLSTYIKRGKIVLESDGKTINTERRENKDFLESRLKSGKGALATTVVPSPIPTVDVPQYEKQKPSRKVIKASETATISKYNLELEKMQAELDKKIVDTRLAEQKLATLLGNNIPIDAVVTIMVTLSKSLITNYRSIIEQDITEVSHIFRIPEKDRVEFIDKSIKKLNAAHERAVLNAKTQIRNAAGKSKLTETEEDELDD